MFVFAQLSTSVSDDQIRLIIIALLVVAVLLAALTIWYFVKTSPTRRVRAAQARRQANGQANGQGGAAVAGAPSGAAHGAARPAAEAEGAQRAMQPDEILDDVDDGGEWDRLTAPEASKPASS